MKHLADHFFFAGELDLAKALCERALKFCEKLQKPESADTPKFRKDIDKLRSDLHFIKGKSYHKEENYDLAFQEYFESVKYYNQNYAAHFCLAKIHYLNGSYNAVDESLNKILNVPKFKDSYEAIKLLSKVKIIQNKRYEALALLKRAIELNPQDYQACFDIAQQFDQIDQALALQYYEQGISAKLMEIEMKEKLGNDIMADDPPEETDPYRIIAPELWNNIGVLRLEIALQQKLTNPDEYRKKSDLSCEAFKNALKSID